MFQAVTSGFVGADQLEESLVGAEIVVIPAGVPRNDILNVSSVSIY